MIPREFLVEMVQFIVLTLNGAPADLNKLPELTAVTPVEMAAKICAKETKDYDQCTSRAVVITAAYVHDENKIYYNVRVVHPEATGLGRSFILHELTHWYQGINFKTLNCDELKKVEIQAYHVQDAYLASIGMPSKFEAKFAEKFVCHEKN